MDFELWSPPYAEWLEKGYWHQLSLAEELAEWAGEFGNKTALVAGSERLSYNQLLRAAESRAAGLLSLGVKPGERVLVQLPNRASFVITLFALFRIGALPILAMPASGEADVTALCAQAEASAYITIGSYQGRDYRPLIKKMAAQPSVRLVMTEGGVDGTLSLDAVEGELDKGYPFPAYNETAVLLLSGGTTGTPKLIPRRHCDYAYNGRAAAERCELNTGTVYMVVLPVAHNFSLSSPGIFGALSSGGTVVLCESPSSDEAFELIEREKVTVTALVPALLAQWLEAAEWEDADISSLRFVQVGGAAVDPGLAARVNPVMGCKLQNVFGTAEGLICMTNTDDPMELVCNTHGYPICPADELRFVDADGNDVPHGEEGELLVRGPYTIHGYYRNPEVNGAALTKEGFYRTGDLAVPVVGGYIRVCGRIKDQINRCGEKLAPIEIESHIREFVDVRDVVVVGVPDRELGERICAWVMAGEAFSMQALHGFLSTKGVSRYKFPDQLEFTEFWPVTSVGKIDKRKLVSMAQELQQGVTKAAS